MKFILRTLPLLLLTLSAQAQLEYDPFQYELSSKAPEVRGDFASENKDATYIFDKTLVWYGKFPDTEVLIQGTIIHKLVYINSEKALDEFNKVYIQNSGQDSLHQFIVRVIENGTVIKTFGKSDLRASQDGENSTLKMLAVEGLKKGQMLEKLTVILSPFEDHGTISIQEEYPVLQCYVGITCPSHLKFASKSYGLSQKSLKDTVIQSKERRHLFADLGKITPFEKEDYVFEDARLGRIEFTLEQNFARRSKLNSWSDKGRNLMEELTVAEKSEKKFIEKLIEKQQWNTFTGERQLYEIDSYLKNNLNISKQYPYTGNVEKLFKVKVGNTYSVIRVYILIFQSLNIPWQLVLTAPKTDKKFDPEFPSDVFLRDPLFYFSNTKLYLDPTDYEHRAGDISFIYEGQKAMFVKPMVIGEGISGVTRIDSIPERSRSYSLRENRISVSFDDEMNAVIRTHGIGSGHGIDSRKIIYTLNEKDKADAFIEEMVRNEHKQGVFKVEEVLNYNLNNYDEYKKPVEMKYQWTTDAFSELTGTSILFKYGQLIGKQIELYDEIKRSNPIDFYFPHDHKVRVEMRIPEGYAAKGFEGKNRSYAYKDAAGNELFGIDVKVYAQDDKIIMEIFEYYARSEYSPEVYAQFRDVINAAADINAYTLLLEKK